MDNDGVTYNGDFKPRPYQIHLYEQARKKNCIICLPTGSGKTYIAVLLIKEYSADTTKSLDEGGKRIIFIANTVSLVNQQCLYLKRHTGLRCKCFTGDMKVDSWEKELWRNEILSNQVLLMTAQVFLDLLTKSYIQFFDIGLIIFDECHRAVKEHPMRLAMQRFEDYREDERPRVLGLSASLLNSNVKIDNILDTLKQLEITFHSKIITMETSIVNVTYKPKESIVDYDNAVEDDITIPISNIIEYAKEIVNMYDLHQSNNAPCDKEELLRPVKKGKKLMLLLNDILSHVNEMGLYGGLKCILLYLIQIQNMKKVSKNQEMIWLLEFLTTQLMKIQKLINKRIESSAGNIETLSSPKISKLFKILKNNYLENKAEFCCIVFTQRRITARVLYYLSKEFRSSVKAFDFIKPNFTVGDNEIASVNARESLCISKWNKKAMLEFRSGICNCLFATDVIDEGIDVPRCKLVVSYFPPTNFRSYLQSKGRARYKESSFVMMTDNIINFNRNYSNFQTIEQYLGKVLKSEFDVRAPPTKEEINDSLYKYSIKPYTIVQADGSKSVLTEFNALSIINKYCSTLQVSKFDTLAPIWIKKNAPSNLIKVHLIMPSICPLRHTIIGDPSPNIEMAKKAVAFKACVALHKMGELYDDLTPKKPNDVIKEHSYLFPNVKEETLDSAPGTNHTKRSHKLIYPRCFYGAFPQANTQLYLHIIEMKPNYPEPKDNRHLVFYNLLKSPSTFGILSTKMLPDIQSFPIFMNVGSLQINIKRNIPTTVSDELSIQRLQLFHLRVFLIILEVIKEFTIFDLQNKENSFLVVPIESGGIAWSVTDHTMAKSVGTSAPGTVRTSDYELSLIRPLYRFSNVYVVTQVCEYLKANSSFPTQDYESYVQYFKLRHNLTIKHEDQPMLEVKPISKKINCIKPRGVKTSYSRRKRANLNEDFEEHLVPELCERIDLPAVYWLKATALPSILHRLSQLLLAEDLRALIAKEAFQHPSDRLPVAKKHKWQPIIIEDFQDTEQGSSSLELIQESAMLEEDLVDFHIESIKNRHLELNLFANVDDKYPWSKEQEPSDIYRCADQIQLLDVEYYYQFMNNVTKRDEEILNSNKIMNIEYESVKLLSVPPIAMLKLRNPQGPSPFDILQSLTSKTSKETFNYERAETLGDSFLKLAVTLYLFNEFPIFREGLMTALKGKMIGNANLYYCGRSKDIPGRMNIDDFLPMCNFCTPAYSVPEDLREIIIESQISPNFLYEMVIPPEEIFSGVLTSRTLNDVQQQMLSWPDEPCAHTGMEKFLGTQIVSDKTVADCVEALIGTYMLSLGMDGALNVLQWFEILPKGTRTREVFVSKTPDPRIMPGNVDSHIPWASSFETKIGYKFKNRGYLLQAFTHASYARNQITCSYERLEFLGDALLDFLLTAHIYEACGQLSPGDLTDLRSALVNNIIFACIAVRYGLHTHLLMESPQVFNRIDDFVRFQESRNYEIDGELLHILMEDGECNISENINVPKILGDLFESLIGAIFLDSDKNFQIVWNVIYSIMKTIIDAFRDNVPKQPIRLIYETEGLHPKFSKMIKIDQTDSCMITLSINVKGKIKYFHGFGLTSKCAKCAAAKQALRYLKLKN